MRFSIYVNENFYLISTIFLNSRQYLFNKHASFHLHINFKRIKNMKLKNLNKEFLYPGCSSARFEAEILFIALAKLLY